MDVLIFWCAVDFLFIASFATGIISRNAFLVVGMIWLFLLGDHLLNEEAGWTKENR